MTTIRTVNELRNYLDDYEKKWTEEDKHYLGEFKDQEIRIPYFNEKGKSLGYGPPTIIYSLHTWFILDNDLGDICG